MRLYPPGGYLKTFYTGRLRPEVQSLTLSYIIFHKKVADAADESKPWLSPSVDLLQVDLLASGAYEIRRRTFGKSSPSVKHWNPCSGAPPVYWHLSTRHDWPVKNAIFNLPIKMKGNSKGTSGNSLSHYVGRSWTRISALLRSRY